MISTRRTWYFLLLSATTIGCESGVVANEASAWGGTNILVQTTKSSTRFVFPCSATTFNGALRIDGNGRFTLTGTDTVYAGPQRDTLLSYSSVAMVRITGSVAGNAMTFDLTSPGDTGPAEHFVARANQPADYQLGCRV